MRLQKIHIKQTITFKKLTFVSLFLILSLFSIWQETSFNVEETFNVINQLKNPPVTIVSIFRLSLPYILFIYLFSVTNIIFDKSYQFLLLSRIKNFKTFYNSQILFSIILSVIYWFIYQCLGNFVLIVTALITNQISITMILKFFISSASLQSATVHLLSSISLALLFIILNLFIRDKNITFVLLVVYILANFISKLPLLSILNAIQLPNTLDITIIITIAIIEYITAYFLGLLYINRRKTL